MHRRLQGMGQKKYSEDFTTVRTWPDELFKPDKWKKPRRVFVNSMSDLFHDAVHSNFIWQVFKAIERNGKHTFQILTKRPERAVLLQDDLPWPRNLWIGTSVENQDVAERIEWISQLRQASVRFLSCEPLIGPLPGIPLHSIDWVIVGGESGAKARPIDPDWVRSIRDQCNQYQVPFFFKQWGGKKKKSAGHVLDGVIHQAFPRKNIHR